MNETIKEYLSQAYWLDREIETKSWQIAELRGLAESATSRTEAVRSGGTPKRSKIENAVIRIIEEEERLDKIIDELIEAKKKISKLIGRVGEPKLRLLLELRYLEYLRWDEIAERMHYADVRHVYRLHARALDAVARLVKIT